MTIKFGTNYSLLSLEVFKKERELNTTDNNVMLVRKLCRDYGVMDAMKWCSFHNIDRVGCHKLLGDDMQVKHFGVPIPVNETEAMEFLKRGFSAIRDKIDNKSDLSFRNCVIPYALINGDISDMQKIANRLGYKYFCWNGRVYFSETLVDTGKLLEDIK